MAASERKTRQSITPNDINNDVPIIFLSQKRSKLCHDRFNIPLNRLFYICTWKIAELKLRTWRAQADSRVSSIDTIIWFCCKYKIWLNEMRWVIYIMRSSSFLAAYDHQVFQKYITNLSLGKLSYSILRWKYLTHNQTILCKFNSTKNLQYLYLLRLTV